jgi:hypothetical protein
MGDVQENVECPLSSGVKSPRDCLPEDNPPEATPAKTDAENAAEHVPTGNECLECKIGFKLQRNFKRHLLIKHGIPAFRSRRKSAFNGLVNTMTFTPTKFSLPVDFFLAIESTITKELKRILYSGYQLKWHLLSTVRTLDPTTNHHKNKYIVNRMEIISPQHNVQEAVGKQIEKTLGKIKFSEINNSGLIIENIERVELSMARYRPFM